MPLIDPREQAIVAQLEAAGLPMPATISFAKSGGSIAMAFRIGSVTETFEGRGESDEAAAFDVIRQFRARRHASGLESKTPE